MSSIKVRTARVDKSIGARVRARRVTIGKSQENLADELGLTFQQVQKYEKGSNRIGAGTLYEIARILGVKPAWFYEDLEALSGTDNDAPLVYFAQSSEGIEIVKAWPELTRFARKSLATLAEQLAAP